MKAKDPMTRRASSADVDAYLGTLPDALRIALGALRGTIKAAAPGAEETISYQVPTFKYLGRPLVAYGAGRNHKHCAFYLMSSTVLTGFRDEVKAYDTSAGTIRFMPEAPIPDALVMRLVKARMAATEAGITKAPR